MGIKEARPAKPLLYVLSAGRTGTVFLEDLMTRYCPGVFAEHEPSPSRFLLMLGNLRNDSGLLRRPVRRFARAHQARRHGRSGRYVEINPFLCPVTDLLPHPERPLRIVHILRHPGSWAQSMTTFKASTRYRHIIDCVPFAKPFPSPRPQGWTRLSPFEKSLYRWNWCNERIAALAPRAERYAWVKSEDMFSPDPALREQTVSLIFSTLGLDLPERMDSELFRTRLNPAPASADLRDAAAERRICGPLAATYGYDC